MEKEIVRYDVKQFETIVSESGLEPTKADYLLTNFKSYFELAAEWERRAKEIVVTDATQKPIMEMASVGRKFLASKRIELEKSRKTLKEQSLREGKAIDGIANVLKALIIPIEEYLDSQEHFIEYKQKAEVEAARIALEKKIEEDRIAKEKADAIENERIRIENEKMKAEAIEMERIAKLEREKHEAILLSERAKAEAEKKEMENKARIEKEKADMERKALEEKANAERAKAETEKLKLKAQLKAMIECPKCGHKFSK